MEVQTLAKSYIHCLFFWDALHARYPDKGGILYTQRQLFLFLDCDPTCQSAILVLKCYRSPGVERYTQINSTGNFRVWAYLRLGEISNCVLSLLILAHGKSDGTAEYSFLSLGHEKGTRIVHGLCFSDVYISRCSLVCASILDASVFSLQAYSGCLFAYIL